MAHFGSPNNHGSLIRSEYSVMPYQSSEVQKKKRTVIFPVRTAPLANPNAHVAACRLLHHLSLTRTWRSSRTMGGYVELALHDPKIVAPGLKSLRVTLLIIIIVSPLTLP